MAVHGDDFVAEGSEEQFNWLADKLAAEFEVKVEILGSASHFGKTTTLLNRVFECKAGGISREPDPRQIELIIRDLCLKDAKPSVWCACRRY